MPGFRLYTTGPARLEQENEVEEDEEEEKGTRR